LTSGAPAGGGPEQEDRTSSPRPGSSTFTIEGRAAPGLFVVGWLATIMGLGVLIVSVLSDEGLVSSGLFIVALVLLSVGLVAAAGAQGIERRARESAPGYLGPSPILVFIASIPVAVLALVIAVFPLSMAGIDITGPVGRLLSVLVQAIIYLALIRLLVVDTRALSWREMGVTWPGGRLPVELLAGAVFALPIIVVTGVISLLLVSLLGVTPTSPLPPTGEPVGLVLNLVAGALIAPVGEELFFRAFATTAWVLALGATRGIVRGGLFFAFVHVLTIEATGVGEGLSLALIGFVSRIPVGLVLGWLFVRRGSIWAPIGLHAAFNGILLVLAEMVPGAGAPAG
jgi:membrane protease YdiL (CAAX protease family)